MAKRTIYTTVTPLPPGVPRDMAIGFVQDHLAMIDLNPLVKSRRRLEKPPAKASAEEYHCVWYSMTDDINYFPGYSGEITYSGCFHDLPNGIQTHIHAPLGVEIKEKWTIGGNEPGEPREPGELGVNMPKDGLYIREDCDLRCNFVLTSFVKKNLVGAHSVLVDRLVEKGKLAETKAYNESLAGGSRYAESIMSGVSGGSHQYGGGGLKSPKFGTFENQSLSSQAYRRLSSNNAAAYDFGLDHTSQASGHSPKLSQGELGVHPAYTPYSPNSVVAPPPRSPLRPQMQFQELAGEPRGPAELQS